MEILILIILLLCIYSALTSWTSYNLYKKNEQLESALSENYEQISTVLLFMKQLDEKQMFAEDDDVGTVFTQITDIVYSLKTILGEPVDGLTTKKE
jgi:ABC-type multidrug transport system fused ATPase/permease subunit